MLVAGRDDVRKSLNAVLKGLRSRRAPNIRWLSAVDCGALLNLYSSARVVMNESYVEVPSLLDALACGCNLIASEHGCNAEFIGDLADCIAAEDIGPRLVDLLISAFDEGHDLGAVDLAPQRSTWRSVSRYSARCYQAA